MILLARNGSVVATTVPYTPEDPSQSTHSLRGGRQRARWEATRCSTKEEIVPFCLVVVYKSPDKTQLIQTRQAGGVQFVRHEVARGEQVLCSMLAQPLSFDQNGAFKCHLEQQLEYYSTQCLSWPSAQTLQPLLTNIVAITTHESFINTVAPLLWQVCTLPCFSFAEMQIQYICSVQTQLLLTGAHIPCPCECTHCCN